MKLSSSSFTSLLLILHTLFYGVFGLQTISENAIGIGREIFDEVEHSVPGRTNKTEVAIAVKKILKKFDTEYSITLSALWDYSFAIRTLFQEWDNDPHLLFNNLRNLTIDNISFNEISHTMSDFLAYNDLHLSFWYLSNDKFANQLNDLHNLALVKKNGTGDSDFDLIMKKKEESKCRSKIMQTLLYLLNYITVADAFGHVIMAYNYAAFKFYNASVTNPKDSMYQNLRKLEDSWTEKNIAKKMKDLEDAFTRRNRKTVRLFKDAIIAVSREAWFCNDNTVQKSYVNRTFTYAKLNNLFQTYIINEADLNEGGTCTRECGDYRRTKSYGCYEEGICTHQRFCDGTLWDCDARIESPMRVCLEDKNSNIRYKAVYTKGKRYGNDEYKCDAVSVKSWPRGFVQCTYCTCTCDESNKKGDRYFNLRPTLSNIKMNSIVVNAKLTLVDNVVHIAIQEGTLISDGLIDRDTIFEKPVDRYTVENDVVKEGKDYHTISYNQRTVLIDEMDAPWNNALTGLRFAVVDGNLKLEIHVTPFDFTTGKLDEKGSYWMSSNTKFSDRNEEKFENKNYVNPKPNRYIRFTTNDLTVDVGQTTIPYIEDRDVIYLFQPSILSGAGLVTKNQENEGSILGLKLFTYDYVRHLQI